MEARGDNALDAPVAATAGVVPIAVVPAACAAAVAGVLEEAETPVMV